MQILVFLFIVAVAAAIVYIGGVGMVGYGMFKVLAKGGGSAVPSPLPKRGWYEGGMGSVVVDSATGNLVFGEPHYIVRAPLVPLSIGQTISIKFRLDGTGTLVPLQGATPTLSFIIQRAGDNLSGVGAFQQYRYFASGVQLGAASNYEFSTKISPENWGDVFGAKGSDHPAEFAAAVANCAAIGFVFGDPGAGATGHGVKANGPVSFTLLEFSIA